MSRHLGTRLTGYLETRLHADGGDYADRAIVICTIDESGHAHPAMLSCDEFFAVDAQTVRIVVYASSTSARNLRERKHVTAILADQDGVFYIKAAAGAWREEAQRLHCDARVLELLEDLPAADESARLTTGIRFQRR